MIASATMFSGLRRSAALLAVAALWIGGWYFGTAASMVDIWVRSETFNHGFIVLPIALWLGWRRRATLAVIAARPAPWLLPALALVGLAWLFGDLAEVNALTHFALVALAVLAVPALLGFDFARAVAFPLGFLFFMVPFGEFAMPRLMDWTAEFTVSALRLTGIPVYQEGLHFVIPSGRWSVVEACSGVRYLIASLCVGTIFAYLNYVSLKKRLAFVAVSFIVPIAANWLRAYMIVMIGHLSDGRLAAGVDHLIYGWLFFGVVILIMFAIGARWADPPLKDVPAGQPTPASASGALRPAVLVAFALILAAPPAVQRLITRSTEAAKPVRIQLPAPAGWNLVGTTAPWKLAYGGADAISRQEFEAAAGRVGVQIAYYRNQSRDRKLVSSVNALVKSGDPEWAIVSRGTRPPGAEGLPAVRTAVLRGPGDRRLLVWHWNWINARDSINDPLARFWLAVDRMAGRGDDAAGLFFYTAADRPAPEATLEAFLRAAADPLRQALARTREDR